MRTSYFALATVAAFALSACSDSTGPDRTPLSVDEIFNEIEEVQSITAAAAGFAGAPMASHAMPAAGNCAFNTTSQSFVCPTTTATGVSFTRSFQLFDDAGTPQSAFNPTTTSAVRAISDASGTFTNQNGSVDFSSHDDYTVAGLLLDNLTIDGSSTSESIVTNSQNGDVLEIDATTTINDLVIPKRRTGNRYPLGGSIETNIALTNDEQTATVSVGIAFNGTSTATMTMSSALGTLTCLIDLSKQNKAPNCS